MTESKFRRLFHKIAPFAVATCLLISATSWVIAQFPSQREWGGTSGGSANAQTLTIRNYLQYEPGVPIRFTAGFSNSASTTFAVNALSAQTLKRQTNGGLISLVGGEIKANQDYTLLWDGANMVLTNPTTIPPTYQTFASGSGTYTPTAGTVRSRVRMVGGGAAGNAGGNGGTTTFGGWSAVGGSQGGASGSGGGGAGGTGGTTGGGTAFVRLPGASGTAGLQFNSTLNIGTIVSTAPGGPGRLFGGGSNSGQGGIGTASLVVNNNLQIWPGGGGSGEYVEFDFNNPTAVSYSVGAAGSGGGGPGQPGGILIEEFKD